MDRLGREFHNAASPIEMISFATSIVDSQHELHSYLGREIVFANKKSTTTPSLRRTEQPLNYERLAECAEPLFPSKSMLHLFRIVGWLEGISYLVLLLIAMPLKYLANMPIAVTIVGGLHGGLFVVYVALAILLAFQWKWPLSKLVMALLASVTPTGTFWFDRYLQQSQKT